MKRILRSIFLSMLFVSGLFGCTQQRAWNENERKSLKQTLGLYRHAAYLDHLTDDEFADFERAVLHILEHEYPVYNDFVALTGVGDTIDMTVVETIVDQLNTNANNIRHLFPYDYLVKSGILPEGLSREDRHAFYKCLAKKINDRYTTMNQFFDAMLRDTTSKSEIQQMQNQCANDLFNWQITEVEVFETN